MDWACVEDSHGVASPPGAADTFLVVGVPGSLAYRRDLEGCMESTVVDR